MSDASRNDLVQNLRVFVSCASDDLAEARAYRTALQAAGFTVHLYDENPYGAEIAALVRAQIAACDYFLFLVSRHSAAANRPWVAQELGHALATRDATGGYRPIVIPVYCADQGSVGRIVDFPVRDFDTSVPRPQPLPLAGLRAHDPHRNPLSDTTLQLIRSLQVEVALVHEDIATADELIDTGAIRLYHELFPDDQRALWEEDRQSIFVEDVDRPFRLSIAASRRLPRLATWLGLRGTFRLKSYFFVLLRRRQAIGFVWVTYNRRSRLLYGNFIGVHEQWRRGSLVNPLIDAVGNRVLRDFPDCLGLILEVEPFALDDVEAAVADIERGSVTPEAINIVRSFKRVWWYETSERLRARCIRDVRTQAPLTHMYPCMETDAPRAEWPSRERPY